MNEFATTIITQKPFQVTTFATSALQNRITLHGGNSGCSAV